MPRPSVSGQPSRRGHQPDVALDREMREQAAFLNHVADAAAQAHADPIRAVVLPSTSTSPEVGSIMPLIRRSAVVLPEPLRPSSTSVSPGSIEKCQVVEDGAIADAEVDVAKLDDAHRSVGTAFRRSPIRDRSTGARSVQPARSPMRAISSARNLCDDSVQMVSPAAKGTVRSSAPMRTSCAMRERRCISIRDCALVVAGFVGELREIELAVEFAIDARQQIEIESRGDADRIVVGADEAWRAA